MNSFLNKVIETGSFVQNAKATKILLLWQDDYGGIEANKERKNYMYGSRSPDQMSLNDVTCNVFSRSANQWNNDPGREGSVSMVHLRAGKGGGELVVRLEVRMSRVFKIIVPPPVCGAMHDACHNLVEILRPHRALFY